MVEMLVSHRRSWSLDMNGLRVVERGSALCWLCTVCRNRKPRDRDVVWRFFVEEPKTLQQRDDTVLLWWLRRWCSIYWTAFWSQHDEESFVEGDCWVQNGNRKGKEDLQVGFCRSPCSRSVCVFVCWRFPVRSSSCHRCCHCCRISSPPTTGHAPYRRRDSHAGYLFPCCCWADWVNPPLPTASAGNSAAVKNWIFRLHCFS